MPRRPGRLSASCVSGAAAHYNIGNALFGLGKAREAAAHYEQALRIKPEFTPAQNALARLQARQ